MAKLRAQATKTKQVLSANTEIPVSALSKERLLRFLNELGPLLYFPASGQDQ